jgi:hypothetical protein
MMADKHRLTQMNEIESGCNGCNGCQEEGRRKKLKDLFPFPL